MSPQLRRLPALLLLPLALLGACSGEAPPAPAAAKPQVSVVTLQTEPVTLVRELPGRVSPSLVAEVRPQVGGLVRERLFEEGGLVAAGQPLYQLDDATYRAEVQSARAALAREQATLEAARLSARRIAELAEKGLVSAQDGENATAALAQAEAGVGVARAALARAEVVLGHARLLAPIAGRIGKSSVTQGALVTANQETALATIQRLDPVFVDVSLSSAEWLALKRGLDADPAAAGALPVGIVLEDGVAYAHAGRLAFTDPSVDPQTGSFLLRVEVPNPDGLLMPGMYARARLGVAERGNGLLVPQPGVGRNPRGEAYVMLVGADGTVEQRVVQVSRTVGDRWLVEAGLAAGERVIVEGLQKVRPGQPVEATEAGAAPAAD